MWGHTETSRPDTADVPALGFGSLAVRNHVPHALLSGRANRMGTWVLQGCSSLTRVPQDFNGSQEVPPCCVDAEGEAAGFSVTQSCSHGRLGLDPPTGLGPLLYPFPPRVPPLIPPPNLLNSQETGTMAPRWSDFRGKSSFPDVQTAFSRLLR